MRGEVFVGRRDEVARFTTLLSDLHAIRPSRRDGWWPQRRNSDNLTEATKSRVVLVHGLGGSGKSRLLKQFREMTNGTLPSSPVSSGQIRSAWLDWEDEQRLQPSSYASEDGPSLVTVLDGVQKAVISCFGSTTWANQAFADYRSGAVRMPEYAARFADLLAQTNKAKSPFTQADSAVLLKTAATAGLVGIGHPSGALGLTPNQIANSMKAAGRLSDAAARAVTGKKAGEISPEEYDLVTDPQRELTRRVAVAIRTLARRIPLVILLDTGEVIGVDAWAWLRRVMAHTGPRVVWVVGARFETEAEAGTDSPVAHFVREVGDQNLLLMSPTRFDDEMIRDYLLNRTPDRAYTVEQIDVIARFTRGLPLAISFTSELLHEGQTVESVCREVDDGLPSSVVARLARRYLIHAEQRSYSPGDPRRNDVIRILGLALSFADLRNDPELLAILWDVEDPLEVFHDLALRHDFVLPVSRRLHDDVRDTMRIDLLDPYRRSRVSGINRRALALFNSRLTSIRTRWPTLDDQLGHTGFRATLLSAIWHAFWVDNQVGLDIFIQILPILAVADPASGDAAAAIVDIFVGTFDPDQLRAIDLITETRPTPHMPNNIKFRYTRVAPNRARRIKSTLPGAALRILEPQESDPLVGEIADRSVALMILRARRQNAAHNYKVAIGTLRKASSRTKSERLRSVIGSHAESIAGEMIWSGAEQSTASIALGLTAAKVAIDVLRDNSNAWNCYAVALENLGRYDEALLAYSQGLAHEPHDYYMQINRSDLLHSLGRYEEALAAYDQTIKLDPTDATVHYRRGITLQSLGRREEALTAFDEAIILLPDDADTHHFRALTLQSLGRNEEALTEFDQAIILDPNNADRHYNRGAMLQSLGRNEEALTAFDRAITLDPSDSVNHKGRGLALERLGRDPEALAAYDQAITLDPADAGTHQYRGITLHSLDQNEEALTAFDRAITLDPSGAISHLNRGLTLERLGRDLEALAAYDQAITLDPADAGTHRQRGITLHFLGRNEEALAAFDRAISLDSENCAIHADKGIMLTEIGDLVSALVELDTAERLAPDEVGESETWAGAILWHQGDIASAQNRFAHVAGRVTNRTPFHTAELEAVALCGLNQPGNAERHLLDALPSRVRNEETGTQILYQLLSEPSLPGIDRVREIVADVT